MTIEEKKNYLKRYKRARHKIDVLQTEIDNLLLMALPGGIDYSKDKIQTSPSNDQMINYVIKVEELTEQINKLKEESLDVCQNIIETITSIKNDTYQTVLHRRYILMQSWEEISVGMHYSTQRLYELHCEALAEMNIQTTE